MMDKLPEILDQARIANPHIKPLEPLEAIPITHGIAAIKIDPNAKYLVFMTDEAYTSIGEQFATDPNNPIPAGTPFYVVHDIDNAVRIYEILDTKVKNGH